MSFKIFNEETGKWETHSTTMASGINVLDVAGKFKAETKNVENCLSEIKDDLTEANKAIKYVYDHGGNGNGNGTGSYLPTLTVLGDTEYIVTTDQVVTIQYSFTSNNRGNGFIQLTGNGKVEEKEIAQGRVYEWKVGPFNKGKHNISLNVRDSQGFWSGVVGIVINSGALQLIDNFNHGVSYLPGDVVEIPYEIVTAAPMPVNIHKHFNGSDSIEVQESGEKIWEVKLPNVKGIYKASLRAASGTLESNAIEYTLIAADSETLYMTSTFPEAPEINQVKYNSNLVIDYTNSMLGQSFYDTYMYIDNMSENAYVDKVRSKNSKNYWIVGDRLTIGEHKLKIKTVTSDGKYQAELNFIVNVTSNNFTPHPDVKDGLIAHFEATGNMNNSDTRHIWSNRVTNSNIKANLYNFNYNSNGWARVPKVTDLPAMGSLFDLNTDETREETVLRCSGKSYAVIDYSPFLNGINEGRGFTFEIVYRTDNTGDPLAKVVSCMDEPIRSRGFDIDTEKAIIKTLHGEQSIVQFNESEWNRISFVINRSKKQMYIYCNGILSGFTNIEPKFGADDGFKFDGKIILGAAHRKEFVPGNPEENIPDKVIEDFVNFANCDIRTVRMYSRALTSKEIVDNYIADVKDEQEQMILRQINGLEKGFEMTIPVINIINAGDLDASEMEMPCVIDYTDPKNPEKNALFQTCSIKWQGTSSLEYPIKNYTINIREDGRDYYGWTPNDNWKPESRWTLKANYMDSSQSNNVGSAKFIHDFFLSNVYPTQKGQEATKIRSNIDGFPVIFRVDGVFKGVYTFNIDRYSYNNYGFCKYTVNGAATKEPDIVSYEFNINNSPVFELDYSTPEKELKAWNDTVRSHLKHRYNGKSDKPTELITEGNVVTEVLSARDSHTDLLDLLRWMAKFKDTREDRQLWAQELNQHWSIPHLVDYFLISYLFGMVDNLGKNMVISTYEKTINSEGDQLTIWYPSFYDGDSILGLNNTGSNVVTPGAEMHTEYVTSDSRLWNWFVQDPGFWNQIKGRYMDLRTNVVNANREPLFSLNNIMSYVGGRVSDTIGHKIYNEDFEYKYLSAENEAHRYMCQGSRRSYIERWLRERLIFLDSLFGFGDFETRLLTMRSNVTGPKELKIRTYSPQKTSIRFQAGSEDVVLTTNKNSSVTFKFNFTNGKDNEIKIKGASNLMEIQGLDDLELSILKVADAGRLTNIEVPKNNLLRELIVGNNKYLRTLDVSECINLGTDHPSGAPNQGKTLNLSECNNLRILRCNKTAIEGISFPKEGGVIDELDCSETSIASFMMTGQEYLDRINLSSCPKLSDVSIVECDGLKTLDIPKSALKVFNVENCKKLENIDISFTNQLSSFSVIECPEVLKLNMAGVSNNNIQQLNLTTLLKLEELNTSSSSSIKHIVFGKNSDGTNFNKLKKLRCDNSAIMTIRYALYDDVPNALDLKGLPLEEVSFDSCKNLKEILNINLRTDNGSKAFNECTNLTRITGELVFSGHMTRTFQNCQALTSIPTGSQTGNRLDLSGVTNMSETFWNCKKIDLTLAKTIMGKLSSNLTSTYRLFCGCTGIVTSNSTPLPSDFFAKCTNLTSLSEAFNGCTNLAGGLHPDIFKPMTKLTNMYYAFYNTGLTGGLNNSPLPELLFKDNTALTSLERTFGYTKMLFVPSENLLATNTNLTNAYATFGGCSNMAGEIPERIFRNNAKLTSVGAFFSGCGKITGPIPRKIFDTNNGKDNVLSTTEYFFSGTQVEGEIPAWVSASDRGIFDYSPNMSNVRYCFNGCSKITGSIPEDIFKYNKGLTRADGTFAGCSGLGSTPDKRAEIPVNLLRGKKSLTNVAYLFSGCTNIRGSIPEGFLSECKSITDISGLFKGCRELIGQIPRRDSIFVEVPIDPERPELGTTQEEIVKKYGLFDECEALSKAKEVFSGCTALNSFIPPTLFVTAQALTDVTDLFSECYHIQGGVPKDLFSKCGMLQIADGAFKNCVNLKEPIYDATDEERKYAIPKDLFARNPELNSIRNMFRMDGGGNPNAPMLIGAIHKDTFKIPGSRLRDIYGLFHSCDQITGELESSTFDANTELRNAYEAFGETKLKGVGANLFSKCTKLENLELAFDNCKELEGQTFNYRNLKSVTRKARCFGYCTKLTNYNEAKVDGWAD